MPKIINEHSGSPPKVELWACEKGSTDDFALAYRSLLLDVKIHSFRIPCNYLIRRLHKYLQALFAFLRSSHNGHPRKLALGFIDFSLVLFKIFVVKFICIDLVEGVTARSAHPRGNAIYLVIQLAESHLHGPS